MKKTIRLQQHEEIQKLKKELKDVHILLDRAYMAFYLVGMEKDPIDQSVINAYKLGVEYTEAKHSGKLYEQIKNTN